MLLYGETAAAGAVDVKVLQGGWQTACRRLKARAALRAGCGLNMVVLEWSGV